MALKSTHRHDDTGACRLLSLDDVASYLGITAKAASRLHEGRHVNRFPSLKLGAHCTRVRLCELNRWVEQKDEMHRRGCV